MAVWHGTSTQFSFFHFVFCIIVLFFSFLIFCVHRKQHTGSIVGNLSQQKNDVDGGYDGYDVYGTEYLQMSLKSNTIFMLPAGLWALVDIGYGCLRIQCILYGMVGYVEVFIYNLPIYPPNSAKILQSLSTLAGWLAGWEAYVTNQE